MSKLLLAAFIVIALLSKGTHGSGNDRVAIFSPIDIAEGDTVGDVACAFCSVNIHGDVHGDIAVIFGTVTADPNRTISGDVAILFGRLFLNDNGHIGGDLATALSTVEIAPSATISGDRAIMKSSLGLTVLVGPILIIAGIIGLIIFLVRRNRYPYPVR